jgi:hypothetical protein
MSFMTYKGSYYLIYGCLCRGCVAPSFSMQPFSKPIYCHFIFLSCFKEQVEGHCPGLVPDNDNVIHKYLRGNEKVGS